MRRFCLIIILLALLLPAVAQFRKYSNEFLNIGAGARGLAMGGAQVATARDATAGYWNPAGLTGVEDYANAGLMHADYFAGIAKYDYASLAIPLKQSNRTIGFSLLRFAVDDIPNTLFLVEPDGSINYNNITSFSSADYAFLVSFAQRIRENGKNKISIGGNAKVIHRKVGDFARAWGFGMDAGIQIHGDKWHLGAVVKDITTTFNAWSFNFTDKEKEVLYLTNNDIPVRSTELTAPRLTVGGSYDFRLGSQVALQAEVDLDMTFDGRRNTVVSTNALNVDPRIGLEASLKDNFFVRAGICNFQKALADGDTLNLNRNKVWIYQPSLGAGFRINNIMLDYSFSNLANQSNPLFTHVFSLRINFVRKDELVKPVIE